MDRGEGRRPTRPAKAASRSTDEPPARFQREGPLTIRAALALQRSAGNTAVSSVMPRPLTAVQRFVGEPPEADLAPRLRPAIVTLVGEYEDLSGGAQTTQKIESQIAKLEAILTATRTWKDAVVRAGSEKSFLGLGSPSMTKMARANIQEPAIAGWIERVEGELRSKKSLKAGWLEAEPLRESYTSVGYNPDAATGPYGLTTHEGKTVGAVERWLADVELGAVLKYFVLMPPQAEKTLLDAYRDLWAYDGTRAQALEIYDKYHLGDAGDPDINMNGTSYTQEVRTEFMARIATLRATQDAVPAADLLTRHLKAVRITLNEIFNGAFKQSAAYRRITAPPPTRARGAAVAGPPAAGPVPLASP